MLSISEQKKMISEFAGRHEWKISEEYIASDSLHMEFALENLRCGGIARRFDLVVICSLWQCGQDIYQAVRLLQNVFYPAGIHFAVIQDGFCSIDKTPDEVDVYLNDARSKYHGHICGGNVHMSPKAMKLNSFGYRYLEEENRLVIDESSAAVVRMIFNRLLDGERPSGIAKYLTDIGAENPQDHMCRLSGWKLRGDNRGWTEANIYSIAKNPKYAGIWEKKIGEKDYAKDCEPIIDPETYEEVQAMFAGRRFHNKECIRENNPLMRLVVDDETNVLLGRFKSKKPCSEGKYIFRFKYPKPKDADYEKTDIDYDLVLSEVKSQLAREKRRAEKALKFIRSDEGEKARDAAVNALRSAVDDLLAQVMQIETERVDVTAKYDAGELNEAEFANAINSIDERFASVDSKLNDTVLSVSTIMQVYSENNPWIQCFIRYDDQAELSRNYLLNYIEKIRVFRFEKVALDLCMTAWRDELPGYIREV